VTITQITPASRAEESTCQRDRPRRDRAGASGVDHSLSTTTTSGDWSVDPGIAEASKRLSDARLEVARTPFGWSRRTNIRRLVRLPG